MQLRPEKPMGALTSSWHQCALSILQKVEIFLNYVGYDVGK